MGQAITIPMKLLSEKRPRSAEEKRYGGGEKISGERVDIITTLFTVNDLFQSPGGVTYPPSATPYMMDAIRTPGISNRGNGSTN